MNSNSNQESTSVITSGRKQRTKKPVPSYPSFRTVRIDSRSLLSKLTLFKSIVLLLAHSGVHTRHTVFGCTFCPNVSIQAISLTIELQSQIMKVLPLVNQPEDGWSLRNETDSEEFTAYQINGEKLVLVLSITFGFILFLLLSLLFIFYLMGFMQNVFGWTWGNHPMGRTISAPFFPEETVTPVQGSRYSHAIPPCYGVAHQC